MSHYEVVMMTLTIVSVLIMPILVVSIRMLVRWTRIQDQLSRLIDEMKDIVADKDRVHSEIYKQMGEDRRATDQRLRWLEEHIWKRRDVA